MISQDIINKYEPVIGLEIHAQLKTLSKAFCGDPTDFGAAPNTQVSVISLAHPGTLPKHNTKAVEYSVKMGLACKSDIRYYNHYARKNYFYADLPKGYQITQDKTPICNGGFIEIKTKSGEKKRIGVTRIHMEEDAGKSLHDQDLYNTLVDYNRAGVPLIEIVSEPDIRNSDEAYAYVSEVRKLVRYLDICDGNMEEGSLRCDANISVRLKGAEKFGVKVEVKNMNSISNVKRAIEYEILRQIEAIENGEEIISETRSFDALKGTTFSMRTKEAANDYRYFPEPDLLPLYITEDYIAEVKSSMSALPNELFEKFTQDYGLSEYDAGVLTENKEFALYFEELVSYTKNYKAACNWLSVHIKGYLNENAIDLSEFKVKPAQIAEIISLIDGQKINNSSASQNLFPELILNPNQNPLELAQKLNIIQDSNEDFILELIKEVVDSNPAKVKEYKEGKTSLIGMFMGDIMKKSKGKANPKSATELLKNYLDKK